MNIPKLQEAINEYRFAKGLPRFYQMDRLMEELEKEYPFAEEEEEIDINTTKVGDNINAVEDEEAVDDIKAEVVRDLQEALKTNSEKSAQVKDL